MNILIVGGSGFIGKSFIDGFNRGILKKFHLNKIDYCSLDTEGSEEEILSVFNFKDFYIDVFSIENNNKNKYIKNIMEKNNYELLNIIGYDEIWKKLSKEKNI